MTGDSQARFCERLGVKFPGPTRPGVDQDFPNSVVQFWVSDVEFVSEEGSYCEVESMIL